MYTYDLKNSAVVDDAVAAAMPKHLANRLAGLSKERPSKDDIDADMKRAAGNRDAFIESKVSKASTFTLRAKKAKEVHEQYATNFTMLPAGTSAKRESPCLVNAVGASILMLVLLMMTMTMIMMMINGSGS